MFCTSSLVPAVETPGTKSTPESSSYSPGPSRNNIQKKHQAYHVTIPRLPGKRISQSQRSPHQHLLAPLPSPPPPPSHARNLSVSCCSLPPSGGQCGCALRPDWLSAWLKRVQAPSSVTKGGSPARAPAACCVSGGRRGPTTPCPTAGPAAMPTISSYRRRFPNCAGEACRWPAWQTPSPTARPTGR